MSGGSFKQNPPQRSAMFSFLDGTNGPGAPASSSSPANGLKQMPLQMSATPEEGASSATAGVASAGVTLLAWELREMCEENLIFKDDPRLDMKERLAIVQQQGDEFHKIHKGTHPEVAAFLVTRKLAHERTGKGVAKMDVTTTPMPAIAVKEMVKMFESKNQHLPPASSSSTSLLPPPVYPPVYRPPSPPRAASPVPSSLKPESGPDLGHNRRSDRHTGPGFYEHRKDEDSRLDKLATSAKNAKTPLVLPVVQQPDDAQYQASPRQPLSAAISAGAEILALPPASLVLPLNDPIHCEVGPIRRSDRQTGPGFYEHRQDENSRLDKLTTAAKKTKTALSTPEAGPLVRDPAGGAGQKGPASPTKGLPYRPAPSSPAGEEVARYPVRQTGMGFYEFQQAENDRVNEPKKRARPGL